MPCFRVSSSKLKVVLSVPHHPITCCIKATLLSLLTQDCDNLHYHNRTRTVLRQPSSLTEGGVTCPPSLQVEPCHMGVDCTAHRWNATDWSSCIMEQGAACGKGKMVRIPRCLLNDGREVDPSICERVCNIFSTCITTAKRWRPLLNMYSLRYIRSPHGIE